MEQQQSHKGDISPAAERAALSGIVLAKTLVVDSTLRDIQETAPWEFGISKIDALVMGQHLMVSVLRRLRQPDGASISPLGLFTMASQAELKMLRGLPDNQKARYTTQELITTEELRRDSSMRPDSRKEAPSRYWIVIHRPMLSPEEIVAARTVVADQLGRLMGRASQSLMRRKAQASS